MHIAVHKRYQQMVDETALALKCGAYMKITSENESTRYSSGVAEERPQQKLKNELYCLKPAATFFRANDVE